MNLLLVNKTVMSCILVLQNREDSQMSHESTRTEFPTVIRAPLKVCCTITLVCCGYQTGKRILFSPQAAIVSANTPINLVSSSLGKETDCLAGQNIISLLLFATKLCLMNHTAGQKRPQYSFSVDSENFWYKARCLHTFIF